MFFSGQKHTSQQQIFAYQLAYSNLLGTKGYDVVVSIHHNSSIFAESYQA
jgi:hypothetical protein